MRDFIQLGSAPIDEDCVQVGSEGYWDRMKTEVSVYLAYLNRLFPNKPGTCYFKTKTFQHDSGEYKEVVCFFEDSDQKESDWAWDLEAKLPKKWDEQALKELVPILVTHTNIVSENTKSVQDAIEKIENAGGIVIMPGEDRIEKIETMKDENMQVELTSDELAQRHGFDSGLAMVLEIGMDDVVPACCIHGCEVEPDGKCSHGCPSILIAEGML